MRLMLGSCCFNSVCTRYVWYDLLTAIHVVCDRFWDYTTGYGFQNEVTRVQPGSLDAEAGIYAMAFDQTGRFVHWICSDYQLSPI